MIIKIDVDGVIRDIVTPSCNLYNKTFGTNITSDDVKEYFYDKTFTKLNGKACDFFFKEHADEIFYGLAKPFDKVKEAIDLLREYGNKVIIVTWQPTIESKFLCLNFLADNGIEYDDICFTKDKHLIKGDIIIDDNPEFLLKEDNTTKKYCIDRSYNRNHFFENRYSSLFDTVIDILF